MSKARKDRDDAMIKLRAQLREIQLKQEEMIEEAKQEAIRNYTANRVGNGTRVEPTIKPAECELSVQQYSRYRSKHKQFRLYDDALKQYYPTMGRKDHRRREPAEKISHVSSSDANVFATRRMFRCAVL